LVKKIDEMPMPPLIDHIGWRLVRAAQAWERRFRGDMVAAGYPWFGEARSKVIAHLDRDGTRQADLVGRMGLSKQAVQQLIAPLVDDGLLERQADPSDGRAYRIGFTPAGLRMLAVANEVKLAIEKDFRRRLGKSEFDALSAALDRLASSP
jgi:DNA-binding MarR family transcriptional regulator